MKISLESTGTIGSHSGAPARLWTGETSRGTPIVAWIAAVAACREAGPAGEAELAAELTPTPDREGTLPRRWLDEAIALGATADEILAWAHTMTVAVILAAAPSAAEAKRALRDVAARTIDAARALGAAQGRA